MKISVLTPTYERHRYLEGTYSLLKNQTYPNWEWLIYDTSWQPCSFSDPRIVYIHDTNNLPIGEKRNRLKAMASGDLIVHFDDDDFYAPTYLEKVQQRLQRASLFTFRSWFSFDRKSEQLYYWDSEETTDTHYVVSALSGSRVREVELGPFLSHQRESLNETARRGYGFSFAYTKEIGNNFFFEEIDLGEDRYFFEQVEQAKHLIDSQPDQEGLVVHIFHHTNTSGDFPQYRIPRFLIPDRFKLFFDYLNTYHARCEES